jgi:hypothetical protein
MAQFTLDDIRDAAEAKYGATEIQLDANTTVRLLNPLRLPKVKRDELTSIQDRLEEDGVDQEQVLTDAIRLVAETKGQADKLLKAVNGDLAVLAQIFETYGKGTQVGEASASHD